MVSRDLKGGPVVKAIPSGIEDWSWSPDGRMIYSLDEPDSAGESCNFWEVRIDSRTGRPLKPAERLTNWAGFCMDNPSVTSDGKRLAFRRWSPQGSVYIAELEGSGTRIKPPKRLTLNEGRNYPASWTVDNKAVIFGPYRDGRWRIYKQALNEDTAEAIYTSHNEHTCTCPACGGQGKLTGTRFKELPEHQYSDGELFMDVEYLATSFQCKACGLSLGSIEEIAHAGLPTHFTKVESTSLHDLYEPDIRNTTTCTGVNGQIGVITRKGKYAALRAIFLAGDHL